MRERFQPFSRGGAVSRHRRRLPHWQQNGATYFVTFRLADSVPQVLLQRSEEEKASWLRNNPKPWKPAAAQEYRTRFSNKMERWLDRGYGSCLLRNPEIRAVVEEHLLFQHEREYFLNSFVVMPNHVHVLVVPRQPLAKLVQRWKSCSCRRINTLRRGLGTLWMREYFDHIVRDAVRLERFRDYLRSNPSKAGLSPDEYTLWTYA